MFIGHFGVGLAAKPVSKKTSLGTLFLASQFLDLLWPTFLLLGLETVAIRPGATRLTPLEFTHYPFSHSLLAVFGWAMLFAILCLALSRSARAAIACGLLVGSHWVLDALTHRPDLPLFPGSGAKVGLGLWNHPPLAILLEVAIFCLGVYLYLRSTRAVSRVGIVSFWTLIAFLVLVYLGNLFGPPPPSERAIAWTSQAQWLIVVWGYWIDRHRQPTEG